ncbi:hypothetical protein BKK48_07980 [Rodentibacter heidelbergensis]|uniref:Uncharacterized protein n=2 Tax=Rodentibacter heidelbergensis TaxID=1908258 RepID=A0A1V3I7L5_9PAST|nr:hypothetical protein BKK48_07980 [Rodentibacter heidelbergensis]
MKSAVETYSANRQEEAEREVRRLETERNQALQSGDAEVLAKANRMLKAAKEEARDWGVGGKNKRIVDTVTTVISSAIAGKSGAELTTTALSPLINQKIKEVTTDKTTGEVDKVTNAIAHAVWGAIESVTAGGNVATGAISAAGAELAAPLLAKALYGTDKVRELTEVQKQNIVNLSTLAGAIGSTIVSGNGNGVEILSSSNQGAEIGKRAVEHNNMADDTHPSVEREQNIAMYAKVYFDGDEDKAREFIEGLEIAEARGQIDSVKDLAQAVLNPLDTAKSLWDVVSNPSETYDQILISEAQWRDAYENALENDPKLAGEMSGYLRGSLKGVPTGGVLLTGSGLAMVKGIAKTSDFIKSGKLNLTRKAIPNSEVGIQWGKGISNQGKPWEAYVQSKLPEGAVNLNDIKPNFKTFDHILPDGTAISSKTMDTVGSKIYQNPSKITYTLNKYVDEMVNFKEESKGEFVLYNSNIKARELYLAIPVKTTKEQMKAINKSIDYASSKGTNIIVNKVN